MTSFDIKKVLQSLPSPYKVYVDPGKTLLKRRKVTIRLDLKETIYLFTLKYKKGKIVINNNKKDSLDSLEKVRQHLDSITGLRF